MHTKRDARLHGRSHSGGTGTGTGTTTGVGMDTDMELGQAGAQHGQGGKRAYPRRGTALCDGCVVCWCLVILCIAVAGGQWGTPGGGHHHVVEHNAEHNASFVHGSIRLDNALDVPGVTDGTWLHVHYTHLAMVMCVVTLVQHVCVMLRQRPTATFLACGIGAETTVHTAVLNVLCLVLCAEVSGIADVLLLCTVVVSNALAGILLCAVVVHQHGTGNTTLTGSCDTSLSTAQNTPGPVTPKRKGGATRGNQPRASASVPSPPVSTKAVPHLAWFGVWPMRTGTSFPPPQTRFLVRSVQHVASVLLVGPALFVGACYTLGMTTRNRPDILMQLVPPVLLSLMFVKVGWSPGNPWFRTASTSRQSYFVEAFFNLAIVFVAVLCAVLDVVVPAQELVHVEHEA